MCTTRPFGCDASSLSNRRLWFAIIDLPFQRSQALLMVNCFKDSRIPLHQLRQLGRLRWSQFPARYRCHDRGKALHGINRRIHRRQAESEMAILTGRYDAVHAKSQRSHVARQAEIDCLSGEPFRLSVEQRLHCARHGVPRTLWTASGVSGLTRLEGPAGLFSACFSSAIGQDGDPARTHFSLAPPFSLGRRFDLVFLAIRISDVRMRASSLRLLILTLIVFRGGPIGSLSAFLVGALALAGLTLSRAQCLKNHTASAQYLICADGKCPPLLRRLLSARHPHRVLLRSLKRLCFLKRHAVSLELLKDTAADVLFLGLKKVIRRHHLNGSADQCRVRACQ